MTNQPPKDFLALSHGHEWVNFYESFDKLVQDHLSRSSELLRKAMSLPEVADREVAQIRDDLELRLKTEREQNHATLSVLEQELGKSKEAVSSLLTLATNLMGDLDRLSSNVSSAIATATQSAVEMPVDGFVDSPADGGSDESTMSAEAEAWTQEVSGETVESNDASSGNDSESGDASWDDLAAEVATGDDGEIDLSALAAAEEGTDLEGLSESGGGEKNRPHWLNMSRASSN
jgi:hypothetical protein